MNGRPPTPELGSAADGDGRRRSSSAGAWAAAALVIALGALGFAVAAQVRVGNLERRLIAAERSIRAAEQDASNAADRPSSPGSTPLVSTTTTTAPASPVDPAGARQGIEAAFARAYDGSIGVQPRVAAIDDATGVEAGLRLLYTGAYAAVASSSSATVDDVSFVSPSRAMVGYSVQIDGGGFSGRAGEARVVGGEWKVTRATFCADLLALAAPCGG